MAVDPELMNRFNEKWRKDDLSDCHIWTGARLPKGYGQIKLPKMRKQIYAHRLSYLIHKGEIPKRIQVCHSCDNPTCVNPEHLFLGTAKDNQQDMKAKGRSLYGERNGASKLTERDVAEIRAMYAAGTRQIKIALAYGITQFSVSRIVRRQRWNHIHQRKKEPTP